MKRKAKLYDDVDDDVDSFFKIILFFNFSVKCVMKLKGRKKRSMYE